MEVFSKVEPFKIIRTKPPLKKNAMLPINGTCTRFSRTFSFGKTRGRAGKDGTATQRNLETD